MICLIDNTEHDCMEHLHLHLRKLKVSQEQYYTEYYNKRDLLTGDAIVFKNPEQYLNTDFANKNNLKKWLKDNPDKGKIWAINWLQKRKESKGLVLAPSHVELRSLQCPSTQYYNSIGGYSKICKQVGLQLRFTNPPMKFTPLKSDAKIIIDTREQKPLIFNRWTEIKKIDCGDYALAAPYDNHIYIERKGLLDFIGTFSKELGRFHRELERAKEANSYVVAVVENNINDALGFEYLKSIPGIRYVKTNSAHIFKNVRNTLCKFDNFQILFVNGRKEARDAVIKIFELGDSVRNIDLQLAYEEGNFILE